MYANTRAALQDLLVLVAWQEEILITMCSTNWMCHKAALALNSCFCFAIKRVLTIDNINYGCRISDVTRRVIRRAIRETQSVVALVAILAVLPLSPLH